MAWTGPSSGWGGQVHLEIVRAGQASYPGGGLDQLVFYLPDAAAREQMEARLAAAGGRPVPQIDYLLGVGVRSELIYCCSLDKQYAAEVPGEPWETYYARQTQRHFPPPGT